MAAKGVVVAGAGVYGALKLWEWLRGDGGKSKLEAVVDHVSGENVDKPEVTKDAAEPGLSTFEKILVGVGGIAVFWIGAKYLGK